MADHDHQAGACGGPATRPRRGRWLTTGLALGLGLAAVVCLLLWREARRNAAAYRATAALAVALADGEVPSRERAAGDLARFREAAVRGEREAAAEAARQWADGVRPAAAVFGQPATVAAAERFLRTQPALRRRFLELTDQARQAPAAGRDPRRVQAALAAALEEAARRDPSAVEQRLAAAQAELARLPLRSRGRAGGPGAAPGATPAERAAAVLRETAYGARVARELALESSAAVDKLRAVAAERLAAGAAESALWLAETAARLLGLRPDPGPSPAGAATTADPALAPGPAGAGPTASAGAAEVRAWLQVGADLVKGRGAAGDRLEAAPELLEESRQALAAGDTATAARLAAAALNVLGMDDESVARLATPTAEGH